MLFRRSALVAGLAAMTVFATASAETPAPAAPHVLSEKLLRADLAKTEARSADLLEKATQDWRIPLIEQYRSWTEPDQFVNPKNRKVTAKLLVAWMADETAPAIVREKAHDALLDSTARSLNPDLSHNDRAKGKRIPFCLENLVPLLANKTSEVTRRYAADILDGWWYSSSPDIRRYNPQDPSTWKAAIDMYKKFLSSK